MKDDIVEICGALALGGSLLRRLGLLPEAARFDALFTAVEERLTETPSTVMSGSPQSAEVPLPSGS